MTALYIILLIAKAITQGDIKFYFDHAVFHSDTSLLRLVECYYSVPFDELVYKSKNDTISSEYKTEFKIHSLDGVDSLTDSKNNRFVIPSFSYARMHNLQVLDKLSFFIPSGRYEYEFAISCSTKMALVKDTIKIDHDTSDIILSDILLALNITPDTTSNKFNKNQLQIIPNPSGSYCISDKTLFGYIEIYSPKETTAYQVTYRILNQKGDTVKIVHRQENKISDNQTHVWGINITGLTPGNYILKIDVNGVATGKAGQRIKEFSVRKKETKIYKPIEIADGKYYQEIKYLVSEREYKKFCSYSEEGKKAYLSVFWKRYNYEEFENRINYVNDNFSVGRKKGIDTDRGRIYIKYGPPDERVGHSFETGYKPNEYWVYFNTGYRFIFVDIIGNSDYQLVYSNTNKEPTNPNWQRYINPEEMETLD